ncbi:VWA domain-containing protein [Dactylosporangium sp. NPDC051541]|uniref:VWA domain-containing protein n=1 Tax=Dactylosporangium sp. NPDC051541 TaxID=3363977 RepID=UPI0037A20CBF
MAPSIDPLLPNQTNRIHEARAFIAGFDLTIQATETKTLTVTYPSGGPGRTIKLVHIQVQPAQRVQLPIPVPLGTDTFTGTLSHYGIDASEATLPNGDIELGISITDNGGGTVTNESWELQASANDPAEWSVTPDAIGGMPITWVACDPVAELSVAPNVLEEQTVRLHATPADQNTIRPAPGNNSPTPNFTAGYTWRQVSGAIPLNDLNGNVGVTTPDTFKDVTTPGVYEPVGAGLTVTTQFSDDQNLYPGFFRNVSPVTTMTVSQRPQLLVLVIDRSGSMASENRFENAKLACRSLVHLFYGLRRGVNPDDRVAIVAFEDEQAGFRGGEPSKRIQALLELSPLEVAKDAVEQDTIDFGAPGNSTPIGDGLLFALDLLVHHAPVVDQRYTCIVCTDGQDNSGTSPLDPAQATNGAVALANRLTDVRRAVLANMTLGAIALGPTADQELLKKLATLPVERFAEFPFVLDSADLASKFGDILANTQKVNALIKSSAAPADAPDSAPVPAGNAVYFLTDATADRLVAAVTPGSDETAFSGSIQLAKHDGADYVAVQDGQEDKVHYLQSLSDRAVFVEKLPEFDHRTVGHWRMIRGADVHSTQPLDPTEVLAYVDLHLLADVLLDQPSYETGDRMVLTVRIRHDNNVVLNANVRAELTAPAAGLGEELSALAEVFVPEPAAATSLDAGDLDTPTLREQRIRDLLRYRNWHTLPQCEPAGLFVDHTDRLFDRDGEGNYTNTFAQVFKEGTYNWKLFIDGLDIDGNPFTRTLEISTFASIKVDPRATTTKVTKIRNHPSGQQAARVIITPQDQRHERLGPGKDEEVVFALRDGTFEHVLQHQPAPVFADGTYQRVVLYTPKQRPTLQVRAAGVLLPMFDVRRQLTGPDRD